MAPRASDSRTREARRAEVLHTATRLPAELNRIGFRPEGPYGNKGRGKRVVLEMIRAAA
jgi:hypothetical protein